MCWASLFLTLLPQTLCPCPAESQLDNQSPPQLWTLPGRLPPAPRRNQAENELNTNYLPVVCFSPQWRVFVPHILGQEQGQVMGRQGPAPSRCYFPTKYLHPTMFCFFFLVGVGGFSSESLALSSYSSLALILLTANFLKTEHPI